MLLDNDLKFDFSSRQISDLLINELEKFKDDRSYEILDLGCGDGVLIDDLQHKSILRKQFHLTAVDISKCNIQLAKKRGLRADFVIADAENLPFKDNFFDFIYSWMALEHVFHPEKMIQEIERVLKGGKTCYISTVIKKKWGIYIYRRNGKFTLDPTHIHEFGSKEELYALFEENGLRIKKFSQEKCMYSLLELLLKLMIKIGVIKPSIENRHLFWKNHFLNFIKKHLQIIIPGFYKISIICEKPS